MDCNAEVALAHHHLLHAVDLLAHVHELPARAALYRHRHHEVHRVLAVLGLAVARDERGIEVRRVVLVQHLALAHCAG